MKIPEVYYDLFTNAEIANHIHCFCAAKKLAQAMGDEEHLYVDQTTNNGLTKLFMCPATYHDSVEVFFLSFLTCRRYKVDKCGYPQSIHVIRHV